MYHFIFAHLVALVERRLLSLHLLHIAGLVRMHLNAAGSGGHGGMMAKNLILMSGNVLSIGGHAEFEVRRPRLRNGMLVRMLVLLWRLVVLVVLMLLLCASGCRCIPVAW